MSICCETSKNSLSMDVNSHQFHLTHVKKDVG